jgi:AcrR family transcriptional regulator
MKPNRASSTRVDTRQHVASDVIARGAPVAAAAQEAGVSRGTVHRWLRSDPGFQELVRQRQADNEAMVQATREIISDPKTPPSTRLNAIVVLAELNSVTRDGEAPYSLFSREEVEWVLERRRRNQQVRAQKAARSGADWS